jgi:ribosomal protein L11 methyltransferase
VRSWPALDVRFPASELEAFDRDLFSAALIDFEVVAIDDNAADAWRVFFKSADVRDRAAAALRAQFTGVAIIPADIPDEDWAARSQAALNAVRVGRLIIAPPWDVPRGTSDASDIVIVIQPSMGFGTGHHATTRLCLAHLQEIELRGRSAVDIGTGSGVLALAASRLGATPVLAIDDDPDSIQSARENVALNPGVEVTLGMMDLRRAGMRPFDVVLANLTGGLLASAASSLMQLARPGAVLVLSGFMEHEAEGVCGAFAACAIERRSAEDEWVCVTLRRRG